MRTSHPPKGSRTAYQRVTAAMVAERAGVSAATVSLVVNGKTEGRVSADNIERVQRAISELGYTVDRLASSLSKGSSNFVILVAPDVANPFFSSVVAGVRETLGPDYQLLLSVTDAGEVPQAGDVRKLFSFRPAGLLVDAPSRGFLQELSGHGPLVVMDAPGVEGLAPAVNIDVVAGAEHLALHLAERGHRKVAYLDSVTGTFTFELRCEAFRAKARQIGVTVVDTPAAASTIDVAAAALEFRSAWSAWQEEGVTAVVCATDTHAYGVLQEARIQGLRVPRDLAVAGFDNLPFSAMSAPALTSVELSGGELGRAAASLLRSVIDGAEAGVSPVMLPSRLIIRDST